jgi:hypothetical protein
MGKMTVAQAAARLHRDQRTLRRWITAGTLAAQPGINGRVMIDEEEVTRVEQELGLPKRVPLEYLSIGGQPAGKLLLKIPGIFRALNRMEQRIAEIEHEVRYNSQIVAGFRIHIEQIEQEVKQSQNTRGDHPREDE